MAKNIIPLVPTMMAAGLVAENVKSTKKKKKKTKDMVESGMKNIIGLSMIGATSKVASSI